MENKDLDEKELILLAIQGIASHLEKREIKKVKTTVREGICVETITNTESVLPSLDAIKFVLSNLDNRFKPNNDTDNDLPEFVVGLS